MSKAAFLQGGFFVASARSTSFSFRYGGYEVGLIVNNEIEDHMTVKTANTNQRQPITKSISYGLMHATPKTGSYVQTQGYGFNAATTDIVRGSHRAG